MFLQAVDDVIFATKTTLLIDLENAYGRGFPQGSNYPKRGNLGYLGGGGGGVNGIPATTIEKYDKNRTENKSCCRAV